MLTHAELKARALADPQVLAEYQRLNCEEFALLDARRAAGLTRGQVAELMGVKVEAVARLENGLASGEVASSLDMLRRYAAVLDKRVEMRLV